MVSLTPRAPPLLLPGLMDHPGPLCPSAYLWMPSPDSGSGSGGSNRQANRFPFPACSPRECQQPQVTQELWGVGEGIWGAGSTGG